MMTHSVRHWRKQHNRNLYTYNINNFENLIERVSEVRYILLAQIRQLPKRLELEEDFSG